MTGRLLLDSTELRAVAPLAAMAGLRMFGLFLLLPVVAPHVAANPDASPELISLAVGVYGIAQALMLFPLGWLSDWLGRKPVLLFGFALFAIGGWIGGSVDHPAALVAGRMLQGLGAVSAVLLAAVGDATREEHCAQGMALVGMSIALAFGLAMLLAGPLAALIGVPGMLSLTGWLGVLAGVAVLFVKLPAKSKVVSPGAHMVDVRLLPLCFGVLALHAAMGCLFVVLPQKLSDLIGLESLWQIYLVAFVLSAAVAVPLIVRMADDKRILAAAAIAVAASLALIGALDLGSALAGGALLMVFFAGFNFLEAVMPSRAVGLALPGGRGVTMGMYSVAQALGVFLGGMLPSWL